MPSLQRANVGQQTAAPLSARLGNVREYRSQRGHVWTRRGWARSRWHTLSRRMRHPVAPDGQTGAPVRVRMPVCFTADQVPLPATRLTG